MLISFAVTAKLICIFVFTYADCWFSPDVAHIFVHIFNISVHHDAVSMSTLQPDITGGVGFQSLGQGMMPSGATGIGLGVSS